MAGPDEEEAPDAEPAEAPPPVEPSKKGCSVGGEYDAGINGLMILALAGLGFRRRKKWSLIIAFQGGVHSAQLNARLPIAKG